MQANGWSVVLLAGLILVVVFLLQWVWRRPISKVAVLDGASDVSESEVTARALMIPDEATLFNLIRLAAQDYLLVFVKLPILQVVSVADKDEEARKALMRTIQPVRLDVVLAHPGTLQTRMVVRFAKNGSEGPQLEKRDQVVGTVLKAAGINVVVLHLNQTYSVEHVTELLGLAEDE
ncbi:MAG: DUF2726 domain-containing protein [Nitrospirota bacterium]|nr:DUF2726 domain-containing protein [Nitrospirota bacterium]